jgi:2-methylcitrate dehydratase PrpD
LSERQPVTGPEFLYALILGIEIQPRVGNIRSSARSGCRRRVSSGAIGAAVASAKLLRLGEQQIVWATFLPAAGQISP